MIEFILFIVFGAIVGWIASILMSTNQRQGGLANIAIGIIGSIIGGFLARSMGMGDPSGFSTANILFSILGAMALLFLLKVLGGHRATSHS